jgi:hypothetical protein
LVLFFKKELLAVSTGQRNAGSQYICWRFKAKGCARSRVEAACDGI